MSDIDPEMNSFILASLTEVENRRTASTDLKVESNKGVQRKTFTLPTTQSMPETTGINSIKLLGGGGGGAGGTFLASLETNEDGQVTNIKVTAGSYHILNTNTDVPATAADGKYVYAIIEHSNAGIFKSFKIEISYSSKDPTNLDSTGKFVKFSNILLAEGMVVNGKPVMVQRRAGNFSIVHQLVEGRLCLWVYSSGGTSI